MKHASRAAPVLSLDYDGIQPTARLLGLVPPDWKRDS